jgi:hypothetical protein
MIIAWPQACVAAYHVSYAENLQNPQLGTLILQALAADDPSPRDNVWTLLIRLTIHSILNSFNHFFFSLDPDSTMVVVADRADRGCVQKVVQSWMWSAWHRICVVIDLFCRYGQVCN